MFLFKGRATLRAVSKKRLYLTKNSAYAFTEKILGFTPNWGYETGNSPSGSEIWNTLEMFVLFSAKPEPIAEQCGAGALKLQGSHTPVGNEFGPQYKRGLIGSKEYGGFSNLFGPTKAANRNLFEDTFTHLLQLLA